MAAEGVDFTCEEETAQATFRRACATGRDALLLETLDPLAWHEACMKDVRPTVTSVARAGINVHDDLEGALRDACMQGHLEVLNILLDLTGDSEVDVHAGGDAAFRVACWRGNADIVGRLLGLRGHRAVDARTGVAPGFVHACEAGSVGVVQMLLGLRRKRAVDVHAHGDAGLWAALARARWGGGFASVSRLLLSLTDARAAPLEACLYWWTLTGEATFATASVQCATPQIVAGLSPRGKHTLLALQAWQREEATRTMLPGVKECAVPTAARVDYCTG